MKTNIECPHCHSPKVKKENKVIMIIAGLVAAGIGIGFSVFAAVEATGYYLFALPLFTVGSIGAIKGYRDTVKTGHCHSCDTDFEYVEE